MLSSIALATSGTAWQLTAVVLAVLGLVVMIGWGKMQPLLAFVIASICAALLLKMPLDVIPKSIEKGIGDMLGALAVLLALGAIFGKMIADSGAAQRIASVLIKAFGSSRMSFALALTGFVVGIPLFYNVGFVLLAPLVFSLGRQSGKSLVWLAIPLMAGLSVAHGFLPPHPSPSAIVPMLGADMGLTLLYGLAVGIPTVLIAGPVFATTVRKITSQPPELFASDPIDVNELPNAFNAFGTALLPVVLLAGATALSFSGLVADAYKPVVAFISHPILVMLIAVMVASVSLGMARGIGFRRLMERSGGALREIAPILLIIAGAGALKQILIDSGVSAALGGVMQTLPVPPLVLGWLIAGAIRISLGSATVAGLTAAGLVAPLVASSGVNPNLMVLAVGAGSLMFSHVNDSGFWMFKEYFGLTVKDTLRTWTLMEGLVGIVGLICVLVLNQFVG